MYSGQHLFNLKHDVIKNNKYYPNPHPEFDALLAVMSLGPVGLGDALSLTNTTFVNKLITINGTLLSADRPLSRLDSLISSQSCV